MTGMLFTDTVNHKTLGKIHIYWTDNGKIYEISMHDKPHMDIMAAPSSLLKANPSFYEFMTNFGSVEKPPFTQDVLDFSGYSQFTSDVYRTLFNVPRASLISYGELADMAGYPRAARAVGSAMRKNRLIMVVPCHRVVGACSPGGFSAGPDKKKLLLENEGVYLKWSKKP